MIENDKRIKTIRKIADKIDAHASAMEQQAMNNYVKKQMNLKPVIKRKP